MNTVPREPTCGAEELSLEPVICVRPRGHTGGHSAQPGSHRPDNFTDPEWDDGGALVRECDALRAALNRAVAAWGDAITPCTDTTHGTDTERVACALAWTVEKAAVVVAAARRVRAVFELEEKHKGTKQ